MHATVMLGSIPIFAKARVGGALLTIEDCATPEGCIVGLRFGAGTWPDQLKGFNRFGVTQEIARLQHGHLTESSYYGFMTASHEANLSQAEQSFRNSSDCTLLTVGSGHATVDGCTATVEHEAIPPTFSWLNCPKLIDELRERKPRLIEPLAARSQGSVLPTFLYAVRQAILNGSSHSSALYTHNGETYRLNTERRQPNRSGEVVIVARVCGERSDHESEFRLCLASASEACLPRRIEFRAKSYLKLTLEPDESQTVPVFERILKETEV